MKTFSHALVVHILVIIAIINANILSEKQVLADEERHLRNNFSFYWKFFPKTFKHYSGY